MTPIEYYNKIIGFETKGSIVTYVGGLFKDQYSIDGNKYYLNKLLSILMTGLPGSFAEFNGSGTYSSITPYTIRQLQSLQRPEDIITNEGAVLKKSILVSVVDAPDDFVYPHWNDMAELLIGILNSFSGKSYQDIIRLELDALENATAPTVEYTGADVYDVADFGYLRLSGDRMANYVTFCFNNGFDPELLDVQLLYLFYELKKDPRFKLQQIISSPSRDDAVERFSSIYLDDVNNLDEKKTLAKVIYQKLYVGV